MTSFKIERKVEGGKLFRLSINRSEGEVSVQLTGDFFLEPEEGIEIIESVLTDCLALADKQEAERRLSETIARAQLRIAGFDATDLIDALWEVRI